MFEEEYGKPVQIKQFNDEVLKKNNNEKHVKQMTDITDEEGLKLAFETKDGLYQNDNEVFIAGTKDSPVDHIDDLKLPFDYNLNKIKRGRDADAYYSSHHEMDIVIGHSLGGNVSLALEKQSKKEGDNPYGIVQVKIFGAPVVSGNIGSNFGKLCKTIIKDEIIGAGIAGGTIAGGAIDSVIGFADGGLLTGMGADIGIIPTDMANRATEDNNTSPDRVRYFGDPISAMGFNATTVMPSFKTRRKQSAHSCSGLFIKGAVPVHDTMKNNFNPSPDDRDAEVITY